MVVAAVLSFGFGGSPERLARGVQIAGVAVGGLTPEEARTRLERRSRALAHVPVTFVAGSKTWNVTPSQLGVKVDWAAAVDAARREGDGFGPVRGLRRLQTRFFGSDVAPPTEVYEPALRYQVDRIAATVDRPAREASIVLRGLVPVVVGSRPGHVLDRRAAEQTVVRALAAFARAPVGLPVRVDVPRVDGADLAPVLAQVRTAVSAPVRLALGPTRWRLPRWRIAELLALPRRGSARLAVGGAAATAYFDRLARRVERPPRDATFVADDAGRVAVVPAMAGVELDVAATARRLLDAALSPGARTAALAVRTAAPTLTTAEARGLGITRVLASYSSAYAGSADRIHNLRLAVSLLDAAVVRSGETFSLNARIGERTERRGFRAAPVIVNGEYEEGIGGGVSQVATTVFNAAWEAGLKITERAPHALYIARYPVGRDATLNYPDLDLKFVNDTGRPLVVRAFSGAFGIAVSIYGAPTGRRVVSETGDVEVTGPVPVKRVPDATLTVGEEVVDVEGMPPTAVTVTRVVYARDGRVLYDEAWRTSYRGEKRLVRYGTKPRPPEPKPAPEPKAREPTQPKAEPEPKPAPTTTTPATTTAADAPG